MCVPLRSPRDTNGAPGALDLAQRVEHVLAAGDSRGIRLRSDEDEVVVHDRQALHAVAFAQELLFGGFRVHEDHVRIAAAREVERLARAERHDAHLDAGLLLERSAAGA